MPSTLYWNSATFSDLTANTLQNSFINLVRKILKSLTWAAIIPYCLFPKYTVNFALSYIEAMVPDFPTSLL